VVVVVVDSVLPKVGPDVDVDWNGDVVAVVVVGRGLLVDVGGRVVGVSVVEVGRRVVTVVCTGATGT
jgi:hypothetical protein